MYPFHQDQLNGIQNSQIAYLKVALGVTSNQITIEFRSQIKRILKKKKLVLDFCWRHLETLFIRAKISTKNLKRLLPSVYLDTKKPRQKSSIEAKKSGSYLNL